MTTIIFVDSDASALDELAHSVRTLRSDWVVHTASHVEKVVQLISSVNIDVVVSETKLQSLGGEELFSTIRDIDPNIIRVIFSADAGAQVVLENSGTIHRFIAKPGSAALLVRSLDSSLRLRLVFSDSVLQKYMRNVKSVPAMPKIYNEMTRELASPQSSLLKLASIVESDAGLCVTVLKIVNSSFYGLSQRVDSVTQAVTLLGIHLIKNITLTAKVFSSFKGSHLSVKRLSQLNDEAMRIGAIANQFARYAKLPKSMANHCQLAGMLSNVGELIATVKNEGDEVSEISSALLGAYLMRQWVMPDAIVEAIALQRETPTAESDAITPLIVLHSIRYLQENLKDSSDDEQLNICTGYLRNYVPEDILASWIESFQAIEQLTSANTQRAA